MSAYLDTRAIESLSEAIKAMPEAWQQKAGERIRAAAETHYARMQATFPTTDGEPPRGRRRGQAPGNLRRSNEMQVTGRLRAVSRNRAPHSHLYEEGFRHWRNGSQVAGRGTFRRDAIEVRAAMTADLQTLLDEAARQAGFEVR